MTRSISPLSPSFGGTTPKGQGASNDDCINVIKDAIGSGPQAGFDACPHCGQLSGVETIQPIPVADRRQSDPANAVSHAWTDRRVGPRRQLDRGAKDAMVELQPTVKCLSCNFEWQRVTEQVAAE